MSQSRYQRVLLKISGEGLCREGGFGIDGEQLSKIGQEIKQVADTGVQIALVVGGGNFIRGEKLSKTTPIHAATAHYMGMLGTVINGLAVQDTLEHLGMVTRLQSAVAVDRVCEKFIRRRAIRHLEKGRIVVLAGGTGNPFVTTDSCAALRGIELGVDVVMKATKVDGVYSTDPKTDPQAQFYPRLNYNQVIDQRLKVMDVSAIDLCQQSSLPILVFNLMQPGNLLRVIRGETVGTLISKD
ncbi:MAG: Uridylate kinase [Phycisphaerae bacterium]|nr:Uridylate kinase [Phycisphaerae bacterium]